MPPLSYSFSSGDEEIATAQFVRQDEYRSLLDDCEIMSAPNTSRTENYVHISRGSNMWGGVGVSFYWNTVDDINNGPHLLWVGHDQDNDYEFRIRLQGLVRIWDAPEGLDEDDFISIIAVFGFTNLFAGEFGEDWFEDASITSTMKGTGLDLAFHCALEGQDHFLLNGLHKISIAQK